MTRKSIMVDDNTKDKLDECTLASRRDTYENIIIKLINFYEKNKDLVELHHKKQKISKS